MKTLFIFLFFSLQVVANNCNDLSKIRDYFQSDINETSLDKMILVCKQSSCNDAIPYLAVATMKKAEYAWSPLTKLSYFKKGKKMLEEFIKINPNHIEAKYVRWLTQKMAPSFLGYRENLKEDYLFIQQNITTSSIALKYQQTILKHLKKVNNE